MLICCRQCANTLELPVGDHWIDGVATSFELVLGAHLVRIVEQRLIND